jgi:hypothetical protein
VQGTCAFGTGCRGSRLLVWLILKDRVQPLLIAGVVRYTRSPLCKIRYAYTVCMLTGRGGCVNHASNFLSEIQINWLKVVGARSMPVRATVCYESHEQSTPDINHPCVQFGRLD